MNKLLSGRWLLTIATAIAFLYLVVCNKMDAKDALSIITMVFVLYFTKNDDTTKGAV